MIIRKAIINDWNATINKSFVSPEEIFAVLPASLVLSRVQIKSAVEKAELAFKLGKNIAKNKSIEFLLYFFGERKIKEVLRKLEENKEEKVFIVIKAKNEKEILKNVQSVAKLKNFKNKPDFEKIEKVYNCKAELMQILEKQATLALEV